MDPDSLITNQVFPSAYLNASTTSTISSPSITKLSSPAIYLKNICRWNLDTLKEIHSILFPVHYDESFYDQVQNQGEFAKLIYLDGVAVGTVCSRLEHDPNEQGKYRLYIMTLGVLERYRRRNLGHLLLQHIIDQAQMHSTITQIYLHVQTINMTALTFYHHHGFREVALVRNYYRLVDSRDAYVVVKNIFHAGQFYASPHVAN